MDLVRLLVTAQDDRDEAFQASQQVLAQMERDDPVKFINDLLGVLNPPNDQRPAVFLALVLLQHAFQGQIIEYSPEHSFLESRLGPETDARILDTTLSFFVNPYTPIRNMAVSLFCSVASTQTKRPDLRLKERLLQPLEHFQSVEAVLSSVEAIHSLWFFYRSDYTEEEQLFVIKALFNILVRNDVSKDLVHGCLKLLQNLVGLLTQLFVDQQLFEWFVNGIRRFLGDQSMRTCLYDLLAAIAGSEPRMLFPLIEVIVETSVSDLGNASSREIQLSCIWFWEAVISIRVPGDVREVFLRAARHVLASLLSVMTNVSTSDVLDYLELEPYAEAENCVALLNMYDSENVSPCLCQFVAEQNAHQDPRVREVALKVVRILEMQGLEKIPIAVEVLLGLVSARMGDEAPRVRNAAVLCLHSLVKKMPRDCVIDLKQFIPLLTELTRDVDPTSRAALRVLRLITQMKGFSEYPEFFQKIISLLPSWSPSVMEAGILCFAVSQTSTIDLDTALEACKFLLTFFKQFTLEQRYYRLLNAICVAMSCLIPKTDNRILEIAPELYEAMVICFQKLGIGCAMTVIAALTTPVPEFVQELLPQFIPLVLDGQQHFHDPEILVSSVLFVPRIFTLNISQWEDVLINSLATALTRGASAGAKTEILKVFFVLMRSGKPKTVKKLASLVFPIIDFIVQNIEEASRQYGDQMGDLIAVIVEILEEMLMSGQAPVFRVSIALIQSAITSESVRRCCIVPLVHLMTFLTDRFPEESRTHLAEIPNLLENTALALHDENYSDEKISEILGAITKCG